MCTSQHTGRLHLTQEDRAVIDALRTDGETLRSIARVIRKHYSSVCRELNRNAHGDGSYGARFAQKQARRRRLLSRAGTRKIESDPALAEAIEARLRGSHPRGDWSPLLIARFTPGISHQTIYAWVRRSRPDLRRILPRGGRYRRQYGSRRNPKRGWTTRIRSIEHRPPEAHARQEVGHFEGDTVLLSRSRALLTLVDRKSRFLMASIVSARAGMVYDVHLSTVAAFSKLPAHMRKTLTPDRGGEFAYWDLTERDVPDLTVYFAHARAPWERGTNEHANGLLRRYFPKSEKHDTVTEAQVAAVVWMINHRPRKSLNWDTPCKAFGGCCVSDVN